MSKPVLLVDGMYGIGDNLHQRALLRELMKNYDVWLKSCHFTLYHDLVEQGLHVLYKGTRLRAQARTISQEQHLFHRGGLPLGPKTMNIWYNKPDIDKHGSILQSILGDLPYHVHEPDFSLPIRPDWAQQADAIIKRLKPTKPILILRQLVLRREWDGSKRNPEPQAFKAIYDLIRSHFYVISIADLAQGQEWIEGPTLEADHNIHNGSLTFGTMAALYARAKLVLSPAGHGPILAQAVRTPNICVYGGRESHRTTNAAGAHLAPTLGIDPDVPCDCHSNAHACQKHITIAPALDRVREFLMTLDLSEPPIPSRHLIFATTYVDSEARQKLTEQWLRLHSTTNPEADLLIVDSQSPMPLLPPDQLGTFTPYVPGRTAKRMLYVFPDNVGHLSRGGKDGWGRAFCFGLDAAVDGGYDYVAHIEGDLLFKLPTKPIFENMHRSQQHCVSTLVKGMQRFIPGWCETALMFFETQFLLESNFTERYNWKIRRVSPTPEAVIKEMLGSDLTTAAWNVLRGDKNQITHQNIGNLNLDGVTHCHNDIWAYDRFMDLVLGQIQPPAPRPRPVRVEAPNPVQGPQYPAVRKLNLGCGTNKLSGWENHDADVDLRKTLPWPPESIDYVFTEHCVEHVTYHEAVKFFEEVHRILHPGGILRVTTPSLEQVVACEDPTYHEFTRKWGGEATAKGAARAIIFAHGHKQAWTASLMRATLTYAGFTDVKQKTPGESDNPVLRGVEGHGKVIGEKFNLIESMTFEATRPGILHGDATVKAALIIGGAICHEEDRKNAEALLKEAGLKATLFLVNDQIALNSNSGVACSLHPAKLQNWLEQRRKNGHPAPPQVWAHRKEIREVTHTTSDWAGSSGLFATKVALMELNYERVILCGVPMTSEGMHFVRHQDWEAFNSFRNGWSHHHHQMAEKVRSMSGWTATLLGKPDLDWLLGRNQPEERKSA